MKIASLLAGVAVVAMTATAAMADPIAQGSTNRAGLFVGGPSATNKNTDSLYGASIVAAAILNNQPNVSLITITGGSTGNVGGAGDEDVGATFTLRGEVDKDCAYYVGNVDQLIDFGTIGIFTSDQAGPAAAFDMAADASVVINTNLAGCNTANTVTISKGDEGAMVSDNNSGFDAAVFTNRLEYSVDAVYTAGPNVVGAAATNDNHVSLTPTMPSDTATHGAWKSPMTITVNIDAPTLSLLSGVYEDTLEVEISAL